MREWKHSASKESRRLRVEARRERRLQQETRQREAEAREVALRAALARPPDSPVHAVNRLLVEEPDGPRAQKLRELLGPVAERAPRLVCADTLAALKLMAEADWVRPPSTWQPSGKSQYRLFRSLAEHVLARYPMPPFLWTAFLANEDSAALARIAVHVGAGGSLYKAVRSGLMPVPLTRNMCHELLARGGGPRSSTPSEGFKSQRPVAMRGSFARGSPPARAAAFIPGRARSSGRRSSPGSARTRCCLRPKWPRSSTTSSIDGRRRPTSPSRVAACSQ